MWPILRGKIKSIQAASSQLNVMWSTSDSLSEAKVGTDDSDYTNDGLMLLEKWSQNNRQHIGAQTDTSRQHLTTDQNVHPFNSFCLLTYRDSDVTKGVDIAHRLVLVPPPPLQTTFAPCPPQKKNYKCVRSNKASPLGGGCKQRAKCTVSWASVEFQSNCV